MLYEIWLRQKTNERPPSDPALFDFSGVVEAASLEHLFARVSGFFSDDPKPVCARLLGVGDVIREASTAKGFVLSPGMSALGISDPSLGPVFQIVAPALHKSTDFRCVK